MLAPIASFGLLKEAYERAVDKGLNVHVGNILSSDIFYRDDKTVTTKLMEYGVLGVEMEAAGLYACALANNAEALAVLTVSDHLKDGSGDLTSEERETLFQGALEVAIAGLLA